MRQNLKQWNPNLKFSKRSNSKLLIHRNTINKLRIGELAIPGTHNAGAWHFDTEISNVGRDNFVLCQDRSIWAQLVHGVRYFDFRIAYYDFYPREEDRWVSMCQYKNKVSFNIDFLIILKIGWNGGLGKEFLTSHIIWGT